MSADKVGSAGIRAAVRRLMTAVARPDVNVTVRRRDVEMLLLARVSLQAAPVEAPSLHPEQR